MNNFSKGSLSQRSTISTISQLVTAAEKAIKQLESLRRTAEDEETKHNRYEKDAERRRYFFRFIGWFFNFSSSHDYGKFIRVFVEHLHQQGAFNDILEIQRLQQHHKPKQVPSVRSRRRSRKTETWISTIVESAKLLYPLPVLYAPWAHFRRKSIFCNTALKLPSLK